MQDSSFLVNGYGIVIRVDELQMVPAVIRYFAELPYNAFSSFSSINLWYFYLAKDVGVTRRVGRDGKASLCQ